MLCNDSVRLCNVDPTGKYKGITLCNVDPTGNTKGSVCLACEHCVLLSIALRDPNYPGCIM